MAAAQPRTVRGRVAIYLLAIGFAVFSGFPFLWAALTMVRQDSDLYVTTHNPFVLAKPPTLGHITDLHTHVNRERIAGTQFNVFAHGLLEPRRFERNPIYAGL